MNTYAFPNCCTALILTNFNDMYQSYKIVDGRWVDKHVEEARKDAKVTIKNYINETLHSTEGDYNEGYDLPRKMAFIVATTSSNQEWAEEALREFGFQCTKPAPSARHDTTVRLWWLRVQDWCTENDVDPHEFDHEYDDEEY